MKRHRNDAVVIGILGAVFCLVASGCATFDIPSEPARDPDIDRPLKLFSSHPVKSVYLEFSKKEKDNIEGKVLEQQLVEALKKAGYQLVEAGQPADLSMKVSYSAKPGKTLFHLSFVLFVIPVPGVFDLMHYMGDSMHVWITHIGRVFFATDQGEEIKKYLSTDLFSITYTILDDIKKL